jgi:hypothetical protein
MEDPGTDCDSTHSGQPTFALAGGPCWQRRVRARFRMRTDVNAAGFVGLSFFDPAGPSGWPRLTIPPIGRWKSQCWTFSHPSSALWLVSRPSHNNGCRDRRGSSRSLSQRDISRIVPPHRLSIGLESHPKPRRSKDCAEDSLCVFAVLREIILPALDSNGQNTTCVPT